MTTRRTRPDRARRRVAVAWIVATLATLAACGGDDSDDDRPDAAATTTSNPTTTTTAAPRRLSGELEAGEHVVDVGDLALRFTIGDGWAVDVSESDLVQLTRPPAFLTFATPGIGSAIDYSPDATFARIRDGGNASVSSPSDATVAGLAMKRADVVTTGETSLFGIRAGSFVIGPGQKVTMWIGKAGTSNLVAVAEASEPEHASFVAEAEQVVASVKIEA